MTGRADADGDLDDVLGPDGVLGPAGAEALAAAMQVTDPDSVQAARAMRRRFSPELASAALGQASLRRRARTKLGGDRRFEALVDQMLFTRTGLEQATRPIVARWRAGRLLAAGLDGIVDAGCGLGVDAMAMVMAGLSVRGIERDPETAAFAAHNLALVTDDTDLVIAADATDPPVLDQVFAALPGAGIFLDPARRSGAGRSWRLEDLRPGWEFVVEQLRAHGGAAKLGPGLDLSLVPDDLGWSVVSVCGDCVEVCCWSGSGREAVLLGVADDPVVVAADPDRDEPPHLGELGAWLHEPDAAISRAGLVGQLAPDMWQPDPHAGYYCSDQTWSGPEFTSFAVREVLERKQLRQWARAHDIGTLEIKKRGRFELDPAALRTSLKLRGRASATLVFLELDGRPTPIWVERPLPHRQGG